MTDTVNGCLPLDLIPDDLIPAELNQFENVHWLNSNQTAIGAKCPDCGEHKLGFLDEDDRWDKRCLECGAHGSVPKADPERNGDTHRTQENGTGTDPNDPNASSQSLSEEDGGRSRKQKSQATILIEYADALVSYLHTATGETYLQFPIRFHAEVWPTNSKQVRQYLTKLFYDRHRKPPSSQALQDAIAHIAAKCTFEGKLCEVFVRVAQFEGDIYIDLCDDDWRAVKITPNGWEVITNSPVVFRRSRGMTALPEPERGGSMELLKPFVNVDEDSWPLYLGFLLGVLRPTGPYPIQILNSEQGTGKSTQSRITRELTDPQQVGLRSQPRNEHELAIAATNSHILAFDNLSGIPNWLSDAFCRLATGGGFAARELFTDSDEILLDVQCPIIANGIGDIAKNSDLIDRCVFLNLQPIPEDKRIPESELWDRFDRIKPKVLGCLYDAVSQSLRNLPNTHLDRLPRMADFALWVTAGETALGLRSGEFMGAYTGNRSAANELALEGSPIWESLKDIVESEHELMISATGLKDRLDQHAGESKTRSKEWPKSPRKLSNDLRRLAPNLRASGVDITFDQRDPQSRRKVIRISLQSCVRSVRSVRNSENPEENPVFPERNPNATCESERNMQDHRTQVEPIEVRPNAPNATLQPYSNDPDADLEGKF